MCKEMLSQREPRRSTRINQSKRRLLEETRLTSSLTSVTKPTRKTLKSTISNKDTEATSNDARVHSSRGKDAAVGAPECGKRTRKTTDQPPAKRKSKILNVKERKSLVKFLDSDLNDTILAEVVEDDLKQQLLADSLKNLIEALCGNEHLLTTITSCHCKLFSQLYMDCNKMPDPMLNFQICWFNQCSAFLLSAEHNIAVINLKELPECDVSDTRDAWLHFCSANGTPVPESNPVMMTITATIYRVLLERVMSLQESLTATNTVATAREFTDGDDVYYRFGGAAICDMLKLHYKQIRSCSDDDRDHLSQEIVILQAIKTDDKSAIPDYLKYRDQGYMYFPHITLIPFLRTVDNAVKAVVNSSGLDENGSELIKVCYIYIVTASFLLVFLVCMHVFFSIGCSQNASNTFRHSRNI